MSQNTTSDSPSKRSYEHLLEKTMSNLKKLKKNQHRDSASLQTLLISEVVLPTSKPYLHKHKSKADDCCSGCCFYQQAAIE